MFIKAAAKGLTITKKKTDDEGAWHGKEDRVREGETLLMSSNCSSQDEGETEGG